MRSSANRYQSKVWAERDGAPEQALAQIQGRKTNGNSSLIRTPRHLPIDLRTRHAIIARRSHDEYARACGRCDDARRPKSEP
jgi:hypothetical protein